MNKISACPNIMKGELESTLAITGFSKIKSNTILRSNSSFFLNSNIQPTLLSSIICKLREHIN